MGTMWKRETRVEPSGLVSVLILPYSTNGESAKPSLLDISFSRNPFSKSSCAKTRNAMIIEKPDWVHHSVEDQSAGALQPLMPECMSVYFQSVAPN